MEQIVGLRVEGAPPYAKDYQIWIVRVDELHQDKAWFFGAYETEEYAKEIVKDIHRAVIVLNPVTEGI
ncbi:hypothetical protein SAMN04487830_12944 [Pseudobutyrivibrio sp. OR37]|uniref:hypothetical protein n=1 Tax=Pseudobutyrivibrio sp. OR37 TaxID=1798186 RepID=UPI0008ECEB9D|nr:hypothetical protein [Pseudobutyrivibrio sp. OR37]SFI19749.1 hypothetical protein SAMN04487830_12944 [Pseudobutyrivibrio sp. OR37]